MNPTILLNTPIGSHTAAFRGGRGNETTSLPRAETSLDLLARFVLMRGKAPAHASVISVGTVALFSDSCPSAEKAARNLWEPVMAR